LTSEQLEASRAERMRLDGHGALTLEDARTWIEETGLCLFLPRRQYSSSIAPSFVEAVAGKRDATPDRGIVVLAEELLVRLETDGVAVRLNLLGLPGEAPDFVVASWVLPYVYALRGDRDWRRTPQLTGSRQVSQLAIEAYKLLEAGDTTLAKLTHTLGREVTEAAVLRAITELWQQLRIIPVVSAPGKAAQWQLLRLRFQKAIAEGASTSQVTAISVLASIYLQAVIAAGMEEVELFLAPLTARSKVREVLRGLAATRQVHTISLGHAPLFYVAGTLPEFAVAPTIYASSSMPASAYFLRFNDHEEELPEPAAAKSSLPEAAAPHKPAEAHAPRTAAARKPAASGKSAAARPHFSRPATHSRDRKPAQSSLSRPARRVAADSRAASARPASGARPASAACWSPKAAASANGKRNGAHAGTASGNGKLSNGNGRPAARPANGASSSTRSAKSPAPAWGQRKVHSNGSKPAGKPAVTSRSASSPVRGASAPRGSSRKPALAAGAKAGNSKRFGFTARPKQGTKKRG
jgi:23S rRNA pseudouridine2605 synthase